jgi:hypothetical protein
MKWVVCVTRYIPLLVIHIELRLMMKPLVRLLFNNAQMCAAFFQRSGNKRHEEGELYRLASCWYSSSSFSLPMFYVSVYFFFIFYFILKKKKSKIPVVFLYDSTCVMSGSEYGDGTNVERERTTRHIWLMNFGRVSGSFCVNAVGRQLHFFFLSFFVGWRCAPLVILSVCFTNPAVASDGQEGSHAGLSNHKESRQSRSSQRLLISCFPSSFVTHKRL